MQRSLAKALALGAALLAPAAAEAPVQKVIQMLTDMKVKGNKDMAVEKQVFEAYAKFTRGQARDLTQEMTYTSAAVEKLTSEITKHESDVQAMTGKIREIQAEAATLEADLKSTKELREVERAKFLEQQTSYEESLYALDRAIQLLMAETHDRPQAMALLQKEAGAPGMRRVLARLALAQMGESSSEVQPSGAPAVAAYEFQSSGILDTLKQLRKKFKEELGVLQKEEMNSAHASSMEELHMGNTLSNLNSQESDLTESKARTLKAAAEAERSLASNKKSLAEAKKFLADVQATFETKKATYESNQEVRSQEIKALEKAIEVMSASKVVNAYSTHVKSFVQSPEDVATRRSPSFLQTRAAAERAGLKSDAVRYLRRRAKELHSEALTSLAQRAAENPFGKVIEMIKSLLERLKEEAASEADHKSYCDEELRKNKQKRKEMSSTAARLHAEIEEKTMAIAEMQKEIETLAQEQAELRKNVADATAVRKEEKEKNLKAIADSVEAQKAVKQAMAVLAEFYSQQGSLVQVAGRAGQVPEMEAYKGMTGSSTGVLGLLEVIDSDFARVEAESRSAETQGEAEYKKFMEDAEADLKRKHDSEFQLGLKKDQAEFEREQLQKDLDGTQEQLKMANLYYEELKPQCVTVHVSFEERQTRRTEEIKALKEAYSILDAKASGK